MELPILFGDLDGLIQVVIFLFIVISSLAGQFMKPKKPKVRPRPRQVPPANPQARPNIPPPPGQPVQRPVAQPGQPGNALESEIEAFLRKAAGKPPGQQQQAKPVPVQVVKPVQRTPQRQQAKPRKSIRSQPPPQRRPPRSESVAEHVQQHIGSGGLEDRDAHLGERIGQADERVESHLHDVFDHDVGSITPSTPLDDYVDEGTDSAVWDEPTSAGQGAVVNADEVAEMLRSPTEISKAMIMAEIMKRPEHDWD